MALGHGCVERVKDAELLGVGAKLNELGQVFRGLVTLHAGDAGAGGIGEDPGLNIELLQILLGEANQDLPGRIEQLRRPRAAELLQERRAREQV